MEIENEIPSMVNNKASVFRIEEVVMVGGSIISLDKIQPERIVPMASRLRDLVRLLSSSLVGESGLKFGLVRKQKNMIRNEYTEVSRVAIKERITPRNFDSLVKPISRIKSFE